MSGGSGELPGEGAPETRGSLLARRQLCPPSKTPNFLAVLRAVEDELLTPQVSTVLNERCADITQCQRTVGEGLLLEGHKPGDHAQADTVPSAAGHRPPASE